MRYDIYIYVIRRLKVKIPMLQLFLTRAAAGEGCDLPERQSSRDGKMTIMNEKINTGSKHFQIIQQK